MNTPFVHLTDIETGDPAVRLSWATYTIVVMTGWLPISEPRSTPGGLRRASEWQPDNRQHNLRVLKPLHALAEPDGFVPAVGANNEIYILLPGGFSAFPTDRTFESIGLSGDEPLHHEFEAARAASDILVAAYIEKLNDYARDTYRELQILARLEDDRITFSARVMVDVVGRCSAGDSVDFGCEGPADIELRDIDWRYPDTDAVDETAARVPRCISS